MKNKVWIILPIVVMAVIAIVISVNMKPTETDFARWMEDTYEVQCLDKHCDTFNLEEGKILMHAVQGGYSPGIFVSRINKVYRNYDDPSFHLELKASGFLENITIEKETMRGMHKR